MGNYYKDFTASFLWELCDKECLVYVPFYGYIPSDILVTYYKIRHRPTILVSECEHVKACKCELEKRCAKRG